MEPTSDSARRTRIWMFGDGGTIDVDFFGASDAANAVVIQPDGKIVAAGSAVNGTSTGLGMVRVLP